jgi:3alpha(or 20beta)-hydroxysteroid dehydrogenase
LTLSPFDLEGKVAIVTGGARGLGAAQAAMLSRCGAKVVVTARDSGGTGDGEAVAQSLPDAIFVRHDVTSAADWVSVVATTLDRYGHIDVLVNNAGFSAGGSVLEVDLADYAQSVAVNQTGPLLGIKLVAPHMGAGGSIVNIVSIGGLNGSRGAVSYTMSKWALRGLTRCAALDLAPRGIRVNAVIPGRMETPMLDSVRPRLRPTDDGSDPAARGIPLGRVGLPDEVAHVVAFLASELSSFCSGGEYAVDGAQSVQLVVE